MSFNIEHEFTERARAALKSEGAHDHEAGACPYPTVPVVGDWIAFDWLLDRRVFTVVSRVFTWDSSQHLSVLLMLDLLDGHLEDRQSRTGT